MTPSVWKRIYSFFIQCHTFTIPGEMCHHQGNSNYLQALSYVYKHITHLVKDYIIYIICITLCIAQSYMSSSRLYLQPWYNIMHSNSSHRAIFRGLKRQTKRLEKQWTIFPNSNFLVVWEICCVFSVCSKLLKFDSCKSWLRIILVLYRVPSPVHY